MANQTSKASGCYVFSVVLMTIVLLGTLTTNAYFAFFRRMFERNINGTHMKENDFEISPAGWAFSIWGLIYSWQMVFAMYCILSIYRKFNLRRVSLLVFPFYILNNFCNIAWWVVAERNMYWAGLGTIAGLPLTLYICMAISIRRLYQKKCKYYWYTYAVHNAWAVYAGWTSVATLLYAGIALIHGDLELEQQMTGTIMLGALMFMLVVFCTLELTVLDKHLRHVWTHYIALIDACAGSLYQNWDPQNRNTIITVAIAGFVACAFLVKIMRMITEKCKRGDRPHTKKMYNWNEQ